MTTNSREYSRQYARDWRRRHGAIVLADVTDPAERERLAAVYATRESIRRNRREPGACIICGHLSLDPTCPVCVSESNGDGYNAAAWEVILHGVGV